MVQLISKLTENVTDQNQYKCLNNHLSIIAFVFGLFAVALQHANRSENSSDYIKHALQRGCSSLK